MAIISEYEEDAEDVETVVRANLQDEDDGYENEEEDYPPEPYSSRPSDATSSERPYDEVLGYLLREHRQQPLDLLSTVIEFLFRETGIASEEGVDVRVSEMLTAAKRRRVDTDDIEDVFGGPDKIAKLDEIFDTPEEEDKQDVSLSESTQGSNLLSQSSIAFVHEKETVVITPSEYRTPDICEGHSEASDDRRNVVNVNDDDDEKLNEARDTAIITPAEDVPVTSNLAFDPAATMEVPRQPEEDTVETKTDVQLNVLNANAGNGADHEHYSWSQTLYDTTLHIPVPIGTKAKSIVCEIQPRYLKAGLKGQAPLLEGDLNKPVKPAECFWNLVFGFHASEDGKLLAIHLQKHYTMDWWHIVFEGEPEIDVTKVNLPNASLSDLHPDTRRHIEHVMFDEQQAVKELPKNDEERKDDNTLRKFMSGGLELYA